MILDTIGSTRTNIVLKNCLQRFRSQNPIEAWTFKRQSALFPKGSSSPHRTGLSLHELHEFARQTANPGYRPRCRPPRAAAIPINTPKTSPPPKLKKVRKPP